MTRLPGSERLPWGRTFVEGEFVEMVCGIPGSRTEIVMLKSPGDGARLGGWRTSGGPKGSSSRRPSASAEPSQCVIAGAAHSGRAHAPEKSLAKYSAVASGMPSQ
ncbi:hypothetical protein SAMN06264365_106378 [Actinoplanes regularis]|uniref:Uncharacterized protein n=1 Tax=Actinoplanes regularis TaxID=52697 RepID=A0A238ZX05_9ACTN|nr:hypothetical protein Are01nite_66710 [Actinoplanes regularis]SNR87905.1 hypothetical protein SAMN06264365_106378 [Actinoplanes regularis]